MLNNSPKVTNKHEVVQDRNLMCLKPEFLLLPICHYSKRFLCKILDTPFICNIILLTML